MSDERLLLKECRDLLAYYAKEYEIGDEASELQHWPRDEVARCKAAHDMLPRIDSLLASTPEREGVIEDDPIVGHKTLRDDSHIPLHKREADAIIARVELAEEQRRAAMPDEQSAIMAWFNAWIRLKDFGWRDAVYCPKDGSPFLVLEAGSTGQHIAHYSGEWPKGSWWIEDEGDLWPSRPTLFKESSALKKSGQGGGG